MVTAFVPPFPSGTLTVWEKGSSVLLKKSEEENVNKGNRSKYVNTPD